jgi:phosphotransferase system enzyme I (PtsP)
MSSTGPSLVSSPASAKIHERGSEARLDAVLDFVAFVSKPMPLTTMLDGAPQRVAGILGADVVSLYLLEGGGEHLVLRGNVGFPLGARGNVRLEVGEGITGLSVLHMRPISVVGAPKHEKYRRFPELGEDRFPVFLAVPILGHTRAIGAIVVQREGSEAFSPSDVDLLVALTAPIATALRHAELLDDMREKVHRRAGGGTRKVTLPGKPLVPGRVLGAIWATRRPPSRAKKGGHPKDELARLRAAFDETDRAIVGLLDRAAKLGFGADARFLDTYLQIVRDARLKARALELAEQQGGAAQALTTVAREAARAARGIVGDPFLEERARDIEDLCDALLMLATPDLRAEMPTKALLIADQITLFDLLVTSRADPVGLALSQMADGPRTSVLVALAGLPAIGDVAGLFRWASPGDVALLDADHGFLVVNPSRAEIASVRAERRKRRVGEGALSLADDSYEG